MCLAFFILVYESDSESPFESKFIWSYLSANLPLYNIRSQPGGQMVAQKPGVFALVSALIYNFSAIR